MPSPGCSTGWRPEREIVILPPFYYGAASYAVAGPEGTGNLQVDAGKLAPFAEEMFHALLRIGFRNIHAMIHHQTENFAHGMPTDLAFRFAGRQAMFRFLEHERGEGWWGDAAMQDYYAQQAAGEDPFNWIRIHPLMTPEIIAELSVRPCRDRGNLADAGAGARGGRDGAASGRAPVVCGNAPQAATAELGERGRCADP